MMETLLAKRTYTDDLGQLREFQYWLITERTNYDGLEYEDYGVRITEPEGESETILSLTVDSMRMDELMRLLICNCVTPIGLRDVIQDWL